MIIFTQSRRHPTVIARSTYVNTDLRNSGSTEAELPELKKSNFNINRLLIIIFYTLNGSCLQMCTFLTSEELLLIPRDKFNDLY